MTVRRLVLSKWLLEILKKSLAIKSTHLGKVFITVQVSVSCDNLIVIKGVSFF